MKHADVPSPPQRSARGALFRKPSFRNALIAITALGVTAFAVTAAANGGSHGFGSYRGAETFSLVSAAPNVPRCGPLPDNIELTFAGSGIDSEGGVFQVVATACVNQTTGLTSDLKATDTYTNGDSVFIEADDFFQEIDPTTCAGVSSKPIGFKVAGGTGGHAGAKGFGTFDFATNSQACNGLAVPTHVWFRGKIN